MKVSVIIPTYNRASLVVETLQSALDQTYRDFEIIVIDDGSTDDTRERLEPYRDRISYFKQENKGVNAARNYGLSHASGEYIALLDSDDLWKPWLLDLFVGVLDRNPDVGFVYSDFSVLKPEGSLKHNMLKNWYTNQNDWDRLFDASSPLPPELLEPVPDSEKGGGRLFRGDIYHASLYHPAVLPSASLYRRSMTSGERIFNEDDSTCGDWEFFARLSKAHGAAFLDLEAAFNRSHDDEVRLMRLDLSIRLRRQIRFVRRVWQADAEFMREYGDEVFAVLRDLYAGLIKVQLVSGDRAAATETIAKLHDLGQGRPDLKLSLLMFAAAVPGSAVVLSSVRGLRDKLVGNG
jgi:glycosyltransferase involved in cell wall biosynthesis